MSSLSGRMNIGRVNIEFFFWMEENQTAMYFLRSRLFTYDIMKNTTAISIKHRILLTFNINKKFNSDSLYAFNQYTKILACHGIVNIYLFGIIFIPL